MGGGKKRGRRRRGRWRCSVCDLEAAAKRRAGSRKAGLIINSQN